MANILQGCQKRFVFVVSWYQLMLYPHWFQLFVYFFNFLRWQVFLWDDNADWIVIPFQYFIEKMALLTLLRYIFCFVFIYSSTSKNVLIFFLKISAFIHQLLFSRIFFSSKIIMMRFFSSFVFLKVFFFSIFFRQNVMLLHR